MKIISKIMNVVIIGVLLFSIYSCGDDDNGDIVIPVDENLITIATLDGELSLLVAALGASDGDLISVLEGTGPFTVLAPTDTAMQAYLDANSFTDISDIPTDDLQQLLLNHVIPVEVTSAALIANGTGYTETSSTASPNGDNLSMYYDATNGVVFNGIATVSTPDIAASNGIIHKIDTVIGLPDVTTFAAADPNFSRLVEGLTAYNFDFITTLDGEGPFTVFAPDTSAFDALLMTNDSWTVPGDIPEDTLMTALSLHVLSNMNLRASDLIDGDINTLAGLINIDTTANTVSDGNDPVNTASIITTDIQASNGVIHVIDTVLITPIQLGIGG